jgi:hypothetical protein
LEVQALGWEYKTKQAWTMKKERTGSSPVEAKQNVLIKKLGEAAGVPGIRQDYIHTTE